MGVAEQYLANRTLDPEFVKRYILGDELGSGGFGFVCAATQTGYDNAANVEVAVKFVFKSRMSDSTYGMPTEAYVLQQCDHPGIIKVFGIYEDLEFYYLVSTKLLFVRCSRSRKDIGAARRPMGSGSHFGE